ncbi:MAG: cytochrome c oxidase subunit II [Actinomycetota bacterium]
MSRRGKSRFLSLALFTTALAALLAACTKDYPYNSLAPAGPVAEKQADLYWLVFWIAVAVFVLVEGGLVYVLWRFRRRSPGDTPRQVHGNTRLEIAWTIIPALLLAGVAVPTVGTIFDLAESPEGAMHVEVKAHRFWWEVRYPGLDVVTANEVHIPAGEQVVMELTSQDVIHSFSVPRLAGKQDVVPGRTNILNLSADEPGTYKGQCQEFCGLSHANMKFTVVAQTPADFDAWVQQQLAEAAAPEEGGLAAATLPTCFACHVIAGVSPEPDPNAPPPPIPGPDLTHLAGRQTIAAGMLPNTEEGLAEWLRDPPAVKAGSNMPDYGLNEDEIEALVEYLRSLG